MRLPYWTYDRLLGQLAGLEMAMCAAVLGTEKAAGDIAGAGLPVSDVAYAAMIFDISCDARRAATAARIGFMVRNWPYDPEEERRQQEAAAAAGE
jgi:hypothetical protein